MKKLTARIAIELCQQLWQWLAENPKCWKDSWSEWKRVQDEYGDMGSFCPVCSYEISLESERACSLCILSRCWGKGEEGRHCFDERSPYRTYNHTSFPNPEKVKAAQEIADFCAQWLKEQRDDQD